VKNRPIRKAINFDLDTKKMKRYYSNGVKSISSGYSDIECFFKGNGFEHRQCFTK
jgi:virulence-associated protein VapD